MWRSFFYDSNWFYDSIDTPDDWQRLRNSRPEASDEQLLQARESTFRGQRRLEDREKYPNFGFYAEHDGEKTLKDFFEENQMTLPERESIHEDHSTGTQPKGKSEPEGP